MYLNVKEVAHLLKKSTTTIHRWKDKGIITFIKTPSGAILFEKETIINEIKSMEVGNARK